MDGLNLMSRRHESLKALQRLRAKIALLKERSGAKREEMRDLQMRIDRAAADLAAARASQEEGGRSKGAPDKHGRAE